MMLRSCAIVNIKARIGRVLREHQRLKHAIHERHVIVHVTAQVARSRKLLTRDSAYESTYP